MAAFHFDAPRQTVTNVKASEALIAETKASEASSDQKAAEAGRGRGQLVWGLRRGEVTDPKLGAICSLGNRKAGSQTIHSFNSGFGPSANSMSNQGS